MTEIVISRQSLARESSFELINLPVFYMPTLNHLETDRQTDPNELHMVLFYISKSS